MCDPSCDLVCRDSREMSLTLLAVVVAANAPAPMTSSPPQSSKEQVFPLQDLPHHKADSKKLEKLLRAATSDRLHWPRPLLKILHHPCVRAWLPPPLKPQEIDIVVSGGGLKGYFLVGARHALTSHPGLVVRRYSGTSAGAWSAMFMAIDFPNADWFATYTLTQELGRRYLSQGKPTPQLLEAYREHMWPWMNSVLPADAHKRCSGKLFVTVTKVENMKLIPKVISKFDSNKELFEACVASSSLPGVTQKGVGSSFKDQKYFDGLFSDNVPVFVDDARPQLVFDLGKIQYALTAMVRATDPSIEGLMVSGALQTARFLDGRRGDPRTQVTSWKGWAKGREYPNHRGPRPAVGGGPFGARFQQLKAQLDSQWPPKLPWATREMRQEEEEEEAAPALAPPVD